MKEKRAASESANTPVSNLVRYVPSGKYFARGRAGGKFIRKCLKPDGASRARFLAFGL
jgi:hypothetical protein